MDYHYGEVRRVEQLSPTMLRVWLGGGTLEQFEPTEFSDQYVNALFVPPGAPYTVPFDPNEARETGEHRPRPRRFTVRSWNAEACELAIDFVAHGDVGFAGTWAQRAVPGDRLQFRGPSGGYRPDPDADWYLLAGDESALPAIAASLEQLEPDVRAVVLAVVEAPDCEIELSSSASVEINWLHRSSSPDPADLIPDAVAALEWADGDVDVFVHGEAGEVRAARKILVAKWGVDPKAASVSPYWRRGDTDESWREVKREWLAAQERDTA